MKKKRMITILVICVGVCSVVAVFLFVGRVQPAQRITWGVGFSANHATSLGLNWKTVYAALLDDLEVRHIKVSFDWNSIEPEQDKFSFEDADWQVEQAEIHSAKLTLVMGMKTLRWPECHVPEWAKSLSQREQQREIEALIRAVVARYKDSPAVARWQVENEPLLAFGDCPWRDKDFLRKEIALVRSLDTTRPVVASDSGEFSFWFEAARMGDMVSTTMYRNVWFHELSRYVQYPLPPVFYARKAQLVKTLFGDTVIGGELQAEPWGPGKLLYDTTLEEQNAAFDLAQFRSNIEYAKNTGIAEHYLWGAEWWYWRKEHANDPSFWNEAQKLFEEK